MKRYLCILLVLLLAVTACAAMAEGLNEEEFVVLNYTGLKMWVPAGLERIELTEEELAVGIIDCFENEDAEQYVDVFSNPDLTGTLDEYLAEIQDDPYFTDVTLASVNDLPCLTYVTKEEDLVVYTAVFSSDDGHYIEISFEGLDVAVVAQMLLSIAKAEE